MMSIYDVPNSAIEKAIMNLCKSEKNRNILRDRIFGGMTYDQIFLKYYPESVWWGRRDHNLMRTKIQKMVDRVNKKMAEEGGCSRCDHCQINETGTCRYAEEV